jgi:aspartyl protease family protein
MLRAYVLILIVIGVAASVLGTRPASVPPSPDEVHVVGPAPVVAGNDGAADDQSVANLNGGEVQLQRSANGHFYAEVAVNGTPIHMLVDTGASGIALSRDDARAAGIATSIGMNDVVGEGADGSVHGEFVTIDRIALGSTTAEQMPAMVLNGGQQSLLGQAFLARFSSVEIHRNTMTLR